MKPMETRKEFNEGRWTRAEHEAFVKGLELYGKEWKKIATLIPSRSIVQIRTHAQKFFQKIARVNFEKQGKQVPDALKSTAIKSSYNFNALQDALNDHLDKDQSRTTTTTATNSSDQLIFQPDPNSSTSRSTEFMSETGRGRARGARTKARRPQRRRKSSRFSVALHELGNRQFEWEQDEINDVKREDDYADSGLSFNFPKRSRSLSANNRFGSFENLNQQSSPSNYNFGLGLGFGSMPEMHVPDFDFGQEKFMSTLPSVKEDESESTDIDPLMDFMNLEGQNDLNSSFIDPFAPSF